MQFDADTVGSASMAADAEICMMAADTMEELGLKGHYVVKVNNRKVLDGVMETIGLRGEESAARRLTVLRALDKYDRLGKEGVKKLRGAGRLDESGDFTKGAELSGEQITLLLWFVSLRTESHALVESTLGNFNPRIKILASDSEVREPDMLSSMEASQYRSSRIFCEGVAEFREMERLISSCGYDDRIQVDPSVVRGLEYSPGPILHRQLPPDALH